MKILQLIQKQQLRGAEIFASQLAQHLMNGGDEVMMVSLFEGGARLPFSGKTESLGASQATRFVDFQSWKALNRIIRTFKPDIIQANAGDTLKYAVLSKLFFRWPGKIVFRNANLMSAFMKGTLHRQFNVWLLSRCDFFISVSENCRQDLIGLYPAASEISATVPVGADVVDDVEPAQRDVFGEEPIFIAVGSFVAEKNHKFLVDVFDLYYRTYRKGCLWLVGDGKLRQELEAKVASLQLQERVRFWGYRNDVMRLLKAADVFVMPSLIEGLPAVILEAMACGVPVVASDAGGIPEVIKNDVTGICISGQSADLYVEKICRVLADREYKAGLVKRSKEEVLARFSLQKVTGDFVKQYKKLLGHSVSMNVPTL